MCLATGAWHRVGFANAREGARFVYTRRVKVPDADRIHAVERYWRVAEALGAGDGPKTFHVPISDEAKEWAERELTDLPRPLVAFAVGSRWLTKRWPTQHFAELAKRAEAFGGSSVFVGVADDSPLSLDVMTSLKNPARDLCARTTLPQLAAVLAASDVMVANDTGPLHLAAALGRPCVAPYTCTKVARHGPFGSMTGGVETGVPCGGSYLKKCGNMICMPDLTPDRLWGRLAEVLDQCRRSRSA